MRQLIREVAVGVVGGCIVGLLTAYGASTFMAMWAGLGAGVIVLIALSTIGRWRRRRRHARTTLPSTTPSAVRSRPAETRLLSGIERDELRELIAQGDTLNAEQAAAWLAGHGQGRHARRVRAADSNQQVLRELRIALTESLPAGISLDSTPLELLERYMEIEAIPDDKRPQLRSLTEKYLREIQPS